jgi:diguanylate cyclase (GGDEF)-like protein
MQAWQQTFGELKDQYVRRSSERLGKIFEMVSLLNQRPSDMDLVTQLSRQFHWLAGSGSMYGYPEVSAMGIEGEDYCNALIRDKSSNPKADVERIKTLLNKLSAQFRTAGEAGPETVTLPQNKTDKNRADHPDVLIIDEDINDLASLTRLLGDEGLEVRSSRTMAGALAELKQRMPHGIVIEIPLPDGDAYDLVEQVRQMDGGDNLAIVIVSKQTGFLDRVRSVHCGADAHFEKPVDMKAMIRRLRYLLDKQKQAPARILSVEDDPDQAAFIRAFLESAGYQVRTCTDPKNFDSYLSAFNPDLVLLDVMLPGMTGYELSRYLRQDERHATLPVIFLTTQGNIEARIEAARAGGDDHLVKPVPPALLLSSVAARLERSRFLKTLLHRDGLTYTLNHASFMEQGQLMIAQHKRHAGYTAMIIVDLDYFRSINERHGYPGGDKVLVAMSLLLRKRLRQSDIIGRYGGDEFGIIAEGLDEQEALTLASRLLADFAATAHSTQLHAGFYATASAGIAILDSKTMDLEKWMAAAHKALHEAKQAGRNCAIAIKDGQLTALDQNPIGNKVV